jgi:hypothetical protein
MVGPACLGIFVSRPKGDISSTDLIHRTDKYIYMYFDNRLTQVLYTKFHADRTLWQKGGFSEKSENDTLLANPWSNTNSTTGNAPFDQEFYLVLNVAVGARNGWFE